MEVHTLVNRSPRARLPHAPLTGPLCIVVIVDAEPFASEAAFTVGRFAAVEHAPTNHTELTTPIIDHRLIPSDQGNLMRLRFTANMIACPIQAGMTM